MLTETQAIAVATYLLTNGPVSSSGYLEHGCEPAWGMACDTLILLGYATEAPRGARLLPSLVRPDVFPRWDDTCSVALSIAEQMCRIRLRHFWSGPDDETGAGSVDLETADLLNLLGLVFSGEWTDGAVPVLWRTAPEEVGPPTEQEFSAQVDLVVADIPNDVRDRIRSVYASHKETVLRDRQLDWAFYEQWRWCDGWLSDERHHGCPLGVSHDPLAQRVRAAVVARVMGA